MSDAPIADGPTLRLVPPVARRAEDGDVRRVPLPDDADEAELRATVGRFQSAMARWALDGVAVRALLRMPADVIPDVGALAVFACGDVEGERRVRRLVDIDSAALALLGDEASLRLWLRSPNAGLRGRRPLDLLGGEADVVVAIRDALRAEARDALPGWSL